MPARIELQASFVNEQLARRVACLLNSIRAKAELSDAKQSAENDQNALNEKLRISSEQQKQVQAELKKLRAATKADEPKLKLKIENARLRREKAAWSSNEVE